jgi:peptide deformylase
MSIIIRPAVVSEGYGKWVYSKSRRINLNDSNDIILVRALNELLIYFMKTLEWVGASSNNIFWNSTSAPISMIRIPDNNAINYLTIINPEIKKTGKEFESYEGCGSFPGNTYVIKRKSYATVTGILLDKSYFGKITLEYELKENNKGFNPVAVVQHECDHLEGKVLAQKALFSYKTNQ